MGFFFVDNKPKIIRCARNPWSPSDSIRRVIFTPSKPSFIHLMSWLLDSNSFRMSIHPTKSIVLLYS